MLTGKLNAILGIQSRFFNCNIVICIGMVKIAIGPDVIFLLEQLKHTHKALIVTGPDWPLLIHGIGRFLITGCKAAIINMTGLKKIRIGIARQMHALAVHNHIDRGRKFRPTITYLGDGADVLETQCSHITDIYLTLCRLGQTSQNCLIFYQFKIAWIYIDRTGKGNITVLVSLPDNRLASLAGVFAGQFQRITCHQVFSAEKIYGDATGRETGFFDFPDFGSDPFQRFERGVQSARS